MQWSCRLEIRMRFAHSSFVQFNTEGRIDNCTLGEHHPPDYLTARRPSRQRLRSGRQGRTDSTGRGRGADQSVDSGYRAVAATCRYDDLRARCHMADLTVAAKTCVALGASEHQFESFTGRDIALGALTVTRVLPVKGKRLVGPWCFLDRFGPLTFADPSPMDVGAHPHMGLQTVTWLLDGELVHYDSLGHESLLRPGGVNVMTAGTAIAHAERTPARNSGRLSGVQLWVALPDRDRHMSALFQHVERAPLDEQRGGIVQVFAGSLSALASPATHHSGIFGGDVQVHPGAELDLPLEVAYEYAALVLNGDCSLEGQPLRERVLYYLGVNRSEVCFTSRSGGRLLLVGGPPFPERILMWWNFVARTPQEIADARNDWEERRRFGDVTGYSGPRLAAPSLAKFANPNPAS
jgi:redox-sensitive bicupin YhaK (pirin superfamily)